MVGVWPKADWHLSIIPEDKAYLLHDQSPEAVGKEDHGSIPLLIDCYVQSLFVNTVGLHGRLDVQY
jgi:hypothetical protein